MWSRTAIKGLEDTSMRENSHQGLEDTSMRENSHQGPRGHEYEGE